MPKIQVFDLTLVKDELVRCVRVWTWNLGGVWVSFVSVVFEADGSKGVPDVTNANRCRPDAR